MNFEQLINRIDADTYERLKTAVELGKWPNGERLSPQQRELSMQAVIAYETRHLPPEQRTGYIQKNEGTCSQDPEDAQTLRWK